MEGARRMVESETRKKRTSSVPSTNRTLRWIGHSRSFKVILIYIEAYACVSWNHVNLTYWCLQESRTVCRRNVQLMPTFFLKMATGKRQIRPFQRPHSSSKRSQQETPSNICKWFILPETRVIDLHFCCCQYGFIFISFHVIVFKVEPSESKIAGAKTEFYVK